ncbi:hypothetical protein HRbin12_00916 [bacterium HR12]|nr:hypothetical protein HRbin12_00916 [bacterium HR12]
MMRATPGWLRSRKLAAASVGALVFALGVLAFFRSAPAEPSAGPVAPMNQALVAGLARQGITIEDTSAEGAIPPAEAVATARIAVPLVADAAPTESLVLITDEVYGPEDASGGVQPLYVERLVWAVVFTGVKVPILGGVWVEGDTYLADMVVFVDARSGEFLRAIALPAQTGGG